MAPSKISLALDLCSVLPFSFRVAAGSSFESTGIRFRLRSPPPSKVLTTGATCGRSATTANWRMSSRCRARSPRPSPAALQVKLTPGPAARPAGFQTRGSRSCSEGALLPRNSGYGGFRLSTGRRPGNAVQGDRLHLGLRSALANALGTAGRIADADMQIRQMLDLDPNIVIAHSHLVGLGASQGRMEGALRAAENLSGGPRNCCRGYVLATPKGRPSARCTSTPSPAIWTGLPRRHSDIGRGDMATISLIAT